MQEPTRTWFTFLPASEAIVATLPGLWGQAAIGTTAERSRRNVSSYSASASASSGTQSPSRPCAARKRRVSSSEGNTDVVTPSSVPMFVIVARDGTSSVATPGPAYSITRPTLPEEPYLARTARITSLAEAPGRSAPSSQTRTTRGALIQYGPPAIATATSSPPAPIASIPMPPPVGVCESEPISVLPGLPKRSRCSWWQMPLPGRENTMPYFFATDCRYAWSSAFSNPTWTVLWSTYETESSVRTRSAPMRSNWRQAIVPVASCVRVWSILRAISAPGDSSPETRCEASSLYVRFMAGRSLPQRPARGKTRGKLGLRNMAALG